MGEIFRRPQAREGVSRTDERQDGRAELEGTDHGHARASEGALQAELQRAEGYANTLTAALKAKHRALDEARALGAAARQSNDLANAELASVSAALAHTRGQLECTSAQLNDASARLAATSQRLNGVLASTSWRVTAPLRDLSESFPRARALASRLLGASPFLRKVVQQGAKALWWTATGQLRTKLAQRRAYRAGLAAPSPEAAAAPSPVVVAAEIREAEPVAQAAAVPAAVAPPLTPKQLAVAKAQHELAQFLAAGEGLALRDTRPPVVSVLVITWNAAYFTLKCLRALAAEMKLSATPPFEVIVLDNASTDCTAELLALVDGVKVIHSASNIGFLRGCNRGALHAKGEALLLLNSDAFVRPGSLRAAWERLQSAPDVGAVGARLVDTAGLLQEAGAMIWADASTQGYCRGMAIDTEEALFARDVGYCSGAFLMTRLSDWNALGGLDERYAPAYYEEVDYCLRLRERGLRVVYEPWACVDHFEFGSEGKHGDAIEQSIRNQKKLRERHARFLRTRCLPPSASNVLFARSASSPRRGRLLVIDDEVPCASLASHDPRCQAMVNAASRSGWAVTVFAPSRSDLDWARVRAEFRPEVEFATGGSAARLPQFLQERRGYYDAVLVSRPENMRLLAEVLDTCAHLLQGTRIVYDAKALMATRHALEAAWSGHPMQAGAIEDAICDEVALALNADAVVCMNELDAVHFRTRLKVPVNVLGHAVNDAGGLTPFEWRRGFVFAGPLRDPSGPHRVGLAWFVKEVWPQIRARIEDATLDVIGPAGQDCDEFMAPGVRFMRAVDDLSPAFAAARVLVMPIHFAAGLPSAILDAAAAGLPVVATPLMAEQLGWIAPMEIRTAAQAASFAAHAVELHEQSPAWLAQSAAARARAMRCHGAQAFTADLSAILGGEAPPLPADAPLVLRALPAPVKHPLPTRPKTARA